MVPRNGVTLRHPSALDYGSSTSLCHLCKRIAISIQDSKPKSKAKPKKWMACKALSCKTNFYFSDNHRLDDKLTTTNRLTDEFFYGRSFEKPIFAIGISDLTLD